MSGFSSEGRGPRRNGKRARRVRRFLALGLAFSLLLGLVTLGSLAVAYQRIQLPQTFPPIQSAQVFDRNGHLLATLHGAVDRTIIPLQRMSKYIQEAVVATEDHGFYQHPAIDPVGLARAAWTDIVRRQVVQGASTITQQLVKNVYAGTYERRRNGAVRYVVPARTIAEKVRESLMAMKVAHVLSKDQILEQYLNTVYFGHGAYGVEAAAETYFGEHAIRLNLLQSATLAGVLHAPTLYDPIDHPGDARFRRDYALAQMARYGYIGIGQAQSLAARPCCGTVPPRVDSPDDSAYFVDYVRQQLIDRYGSAEVYGGGLRVTTSFDPGLQAVAERAIAAHLPQTSSNPSASLVAIDPRNGQILTMVGGRNFDKSQLNLATFQGGTGREAGSAFKLFTLSAAMQAGYDLNARWVGPTQITIEDPTCNGPNGQPWQVTNAPDESAGVFTLREATWHSVNTVFAQVVAQLGPDKVVAMAHDLGIRSHLSPYCSVTLGNVAVNPLEMTNAYATIADGGVRHWATPFVKIGSEDGTAPNDAASPGRRVLDANDAALVSSALEGVVTSGTGTAANIGRPVAGKTGTATNNVDAWFCGYTPQLAACVWMGWPRGEVPLQNVMGVPSVYGGTIPAAIWHDFMVGAMRGVRVEGFPAPSNVGHTIGPLVPVTIPPPPGPGKPPGWPPGHHKKHGQDG